MTSRKFTSHSTSLSILAAGCALVGAAAVAQPMEVVTVEAAQVIVVGKSGTTGAPIKEITIKSQVSYADLDLTTEAGAKELEKRIRDTASSTCNDIRVDFPADGSTVEKCIRDAIDGAMGQADTVIAAKRAAATK
jgi:UrcA family protein